MSIQPRSTTPYCNVGNNSGMPIILLGVHGQLEVDVIIDIGLSITKEFVVKEGHVIADYLTPRVG